MALPFHALLLQKEVLLRQCRSLDLTVGFSGKGTWVSASPVDPAWIQEKQQNPPRGGRRGSARPRCHDREVEGCFPRFPTPGFLAPDPDAGVQLLTHTGWMDGAAQCFEQEDSSDASCIRLCAAPGEEHAHGGDLPMAQGPCRLPWALWAAGRCFLPLGLRLAAAHICKGCLSSSLTFPGIWSLNTFPLLQENAGGKSIVAEWKRSKPLKK